jgi:ketosteroid isomerase-like protein
MRVAIAILAALLFSAPVVAEGVDSTLRSELEAIHVQWFKAFDRGDGATMDKMEMNKLVLVMPTGAIWAKTKPRAGEQQAHNIQVERTLSDVSVRRFGDTAILTGIVTSKSEKDSSREATTVVFVQSSGKWKIATAQWGQVANTQ